MATILALINVLLVVMLFFSKPTINVNVQSPDDPDGSKKQAIMDKLNKAKEQIKELL